MAKSQIQQQADRIISVVSIRLGRLIFLTERTGINSLQIGSCFSRLQSSFVLQREALCLVYIEVVLAVISELILIAELHSAKRVLQSKEGKQKIVFIRDHRHMIILEVNRVRAHFRLAGLIFGRPCDHIELVLFNNSSFHVAGRPESGGILKHDRVCVRIND